MKFHKYFYNYKKTYNFLNTFLYTTILTLIYFKLNYYINKGNISIYFVIITGITLSILFYTDFTKKM